MKISALLAATALTGAERFPIIQETGPGADDWQTRGATYAQFLTWLVPGLPEWLKGDPSGGPGSIGPLNQASLLTIPEGVDLVTVSGAEATGDAGAGMALVYDPDVDAAYAAAHPETSFVDMAGRGFRRGQHASSIGYGSGTIEDALDRRIHIDDYPDWTTAAAEANARGVALELGLGPYRLPYDNEDLPHQPAVNNLEHPLILYAPLGRPRVNDAGTAYVPGTGTILQGTFSIATSDFQLIGGFGVDVGDEFCRDNFEGRPQEGFILYDREQLGYDPVTQWKNIGGETAEVFVLGSGHYSPVHAVLIENARARFRYLGNLKCGAGIVRKAEVRVDHVESSGSLKYSDLYKSEGYSACRNCRTGFVDAYHHGPVQPNRLLPTSIFTASISDDVMTVTELLDADQVIAPGQPLSGPFVAMGTVVGVQLTGAAGKTGTYSVNVAQDVASTQMVAGYNTGPIEFEGSTADCTNNYVGGYSLRATLNGIVFTSRNAAYRVVSCNVAPGGLMSNIGNYSIYARDRDGDMGLVQRCRVGSYYCDGSLNGAYLGSTTVLCLIDPHEKDSGNYSVQNRGLRNFIVGLISDNPGAGHVRKLDGLATLVGGVDRCGDGRDVVTGPGGAVIGAALRDNATAEGLLTLAANNYIGLLTDTPTELLDVNSDAIRMRASRTPTTAAAAGNPGTICWDANYVYVCVAANSWKRSALAAW